MERDYTNWSLDVEALEADARQMRSDFLAQRIGAAWSRARGIVHRRR
ncbi:MAG: hypothetical protein KJN93_10395 [Alphaproteobacteria bacterium]|nr:hypothetical protein [Alphaproteobacteria bacterium]